MRRKQRQEAELSKRANKFLDSLQPRDEKRIREAIEGIPSGDIVPYEGAKDYFRLRKGKYRILFKWIGGSRIYVALIDSRGQVYKKGV